MSALTGRHGCAVFEIGLVFMAGWLPHQERLEERLGLYFVVQTLKFKTINNSMDAVTKPRIKSML
jgi:hypothetical protein